MGETVHVLNEYTLKELLKIENLNLDNLYKSDLIGMVKILKQENKDLKQKNLYKYTSEKGFRLRDE